MPSKVADHVVSEKHPSSGTRRAKKEDSETFKTADIQVAIAGISYLIEDALAAMVTSGLDDGKTYGDSRMEAMMQPIACKMVSA